MAEKSKSLPYWSTAIPIFSLGLRFGIKKFQVCFSTFFRKIKKILDYKHLLLRDIVVNKNTKIKKNILRTISCIIFRDFSMFYQIFISPQVQRWGIIASQDDICQLFVELRNDLKLRMLVN